LTLLLAPCYKRWLRLGGRLLPCFLFLSVRCRSLAFMAEITLRVLDGADCGRVYEQLPTPVTIGREEGNTIQVNDERVSRFHIKIQADQDKIVITDLESTNGTKINGDDIQLRILRYGDLIMLGRTVLLFGSREQIAERLAALRGDPAPTGSFEDMPSLDFELNWSDNPAIDDVLHAPQPPELPDRMSPGQAAQLSELLEYLHRRLRDLYGSVKIKSDSERVSLEARHWQNLLDLESRLAGYLRAISRPDESDD
jgi:FHA domain